MRRKSRQALLTAALWGILTVGCSWIGKHSPYPPDPLLASRKPVEAKPEKADPVRVAHAEPAAPEPPATAVATAPVDLQADRSRLARQAGATATPVSRSATVPVAPAVRRRGDD